MNLINRIATKQNARAYIGTDSRWLVMFATMLPLMIVSGSFGSVNAAGGNYSGYSDSPDSRAMLFITVVIAVFAIIGAVLNILLVPFNLSINGYFLNHVRGFNPQWKSPYVEGANRYAKYLEVGFTTGLVIFLWSCLFIIPGIIKAYAYSMVPYIIHDNPNLSGSEARRISDLMTKGHKGELFVKDMSFIPWYLLIGCTCGLASWYVFPYVKTVDAMYYEGLKDNAVRSGLVPAGTLGVVIETPAAPQNNSGFNAYQPYSAPQSNSDFSGYQPYTPPVNPESKSEERTIILNGEEYKPTDSGFNNQ